MPQITKLRIVNFQYNDGKRLIADELYDFENSGKGPSDVLINLANGGGKSVLVQLMMQPIIPKAKVAGRRIESFFTKSTDHCYVAIEWALDSSKMKLMTGIAMSASDSSIDMDSDRGFQIKYYTFISSYQNYSGIYDIISLPLSRKENGRFIPAAFDDVRNIAKRSNGGLERYASDDRVKWKERLAQYGIIQDEWRLIEQLNSNEDGLSKFFSSLKKSDDVIDKLIIPRIEEKQNHDASREDSSLETMLISYARQFSRQQEIVKEREICSGFYNMLKETKVDAEDLWKSNDSLEKSIENLFAFSAALEAEIAEKKQLSEKYVAEESELNEKIRHIQWEKVSADYYSCKETFDRETAELEKAETARNDAKDKRDASARKLLLVECAHYYGQLKEIESQITAISEEIANRENHSEASNRLAALKYSANLAINNELKKIAPEIETLHSELDVLETNITHLANEVDSLQTDIENATAQNNKAEAIYEKQKDDNDATVEELGIDAFRMLDGKYQLSDLDRWQNETQNKEQSVNDAIADNAEKFQKLEDRKEAIPQEIADIKAEIKSTEDSLKRLTEELAVFKRSESNVQVICEKHGLDFSLRFSDHVKDYLAEQSSHTDASIADEDRRIEAAEEAISAVKRGTLHIPKTLLTFLDSTGLRYTSVENYLLTQQTKGLISLEDCQEILARYPYAAYGVVLDEKDLEALQQESENSWLPSVLPVFTSTELNLLFQGEAPSVSLVAAYSREYFLDSASYEGRLQQDLDHHKSRKASLTERKKALLEDAESVEDYSRYGANWEAVTLSEIKVLKEEINKQEESLEKLIRVQKEIKEDILRLKNEEKQLQIDSNAIRDLLVRFEKLLGKLKEEAEFSRDLEISRQKRRDLISKRKEKVSIKYEFESELKSKTEKLRNLENARSALEIGAEKVSGAATAEIVDGEWKSLLTQYETLLEAQSTELKRLNDDKARCLGEKEEKQKEIAKRGCEQKEFETLLYSDELEMEAIVHKKECEKNLQDVEEVLTQCRVAKAKAEAALEGVVEKLREFGDEALPLSEVGNAFDSRIFEIRVKLREIVLAEKENAAKLAELQKVIGKAENATEGYTHPAKVGSFILEKDYTAQLTALTKQIREREKAVATGKRKVEGSLEKMASAYGSGSADVNRAINSMLTLLSNTVIRGDKYYTLCEHIDANIHTTELRISQIDTDLKEFLKTRDDLIHQCVIQGKQMYEGLMQLSNNSKVKVQDRRRQMLKFDIPEAIDENIAVASIAFEIEKGTKEIVSKLEEDSHSDAEVRAFARRTVGSSRLLRKYIGSENIVLKAYKIDRNPDNSGYRTWEQTQVNNSGAEKFVVYFAVILALMAYTRDNYEDIGGKTNRSVLVLDNPFGPISSKHVLEPMFEISRNYNVQMICLSDISKSDIVSCFDLVIRAVVKKFALSSKEQLTHEGNEIIEHGFYKSEQMKVF